MIERDVFVEVRERERTVEVSGSFCRSKPLTSFLGNPVRILYSEGKYSFAPKKFIKSLAAAAAGGGGGDEMMFRYLGGRAQLTFNLCLARNLRCSVVPSGNRIRIVQSFSPQSATGSGGTLSSINCRLTYSKSRCSVAGEFIQQCNTAGAWTIPRLFLPHEKMGSDTRLARAKCKTLPPTIIVAWLHG